MVVDWVGEVPLPSVVDGLVVCTGGSLEDYVLVAWDSVAGRFAGNSFSCRNFDDYLGFGWLSERCLHHTSPRDCCHTEKIHIFIKYRNT